MPHLLSKSKYIRGLQCDRALWLDVFNPRLARYTAEQMRRFDRGRDFEYAFKATFPDGIDLSAELHRNVDAYPARTAELLDAVGTRRAASAEEDTSTDSGHCTPCPHEMTLFEAGFLYDDVLVLADVVQQREDGTLDIYEVKSGTTLSETYKRDAALQHYVISHCRRINSFSIVHAVGTGRATSAEEGTPVDSGHGTPCPYNIVDLTEELATQHDEIEKNIAVMKEILRHGEPATPTGAHCLEPYACPYQHYCAQGTRQLSLF